MSHRCQWVERRLGCAQFGVKKYWYTAGRRPDRRPKARMIRSL
jgi:hypothetical protein